MSQRDYKRTYLRAPYKEDILFVDESYVFKAKALNISEGGMLLDQIPRFPSESEEVSMMLSLAQMPYLKNFSIVKLRNFSRDMFQTKIIRLKSQVVRKQNIKSDIDHIFTSRIGVRFSSIGAIEKKMISDYVSVFASNLIYLQVLIDSLNADLSSLERVRLVSKILGYKEEMKIALLRKSVNHDYLSLQWL